MDPFATTDIKRRRKKEFSGSNSWEDHPNRLKKEYIFRIRYLEKLLPVVSELWLYNILISIKKHLEQIVRAIDLIIELAIEFNNIKIQDIESDSKLQEKFETYRTKLFDWETELYNSTYTLPKNLREDDTVIALLINVPTKLEEIFPIIPERWLKDIILSIEGYMYAKTKNTILIVHDEPKILNIMVKFLKLGEFDAIACSNAKEALKVIEESYNYITMILLYPMMTELNREKFLQSVKSDERYKHILVKFIIGKEVLGSLQMQNAEKSIERIKSIMKKESVNELTINRKYLPEIFDADLLEISKNDGFPTLKPFFLEYFSSKGILIELYGNVIKFKKHRIKKSK